MKLKLILLNCLVFANITNLHCISKPKVVHDAKGIGFAVLSIFMAGNGAVFTDIVYNNIKCVKVGTIKKNPESICRYFVVPVSIASLMFYGAYKSGKKAYNYFKNHPKETEQSQNTQITKS